MKNLKVLAISSFAAHGMASLKSAISILRERVIPVPTVVLGGLANMPGVQKHAVAFKELLYETFNLVVYRKQRVILYIGYLGSADHVDVLLKAIDHYRENIATILVDPISGDNGKSYVPPEIIHRWPDLIQLADFVFPNLTELKILTGNSPDGQLQTERYIQQFTYRFPNTALVITSLTTEDNRTGILLYYKGRNFMYSQKLLSCIYSGTGDAFISFFILNHYYYLLKLEPSLKVAADQVYDSIVLSMQQRTDELMLVDIDE